MICRKCKEQIPDGSAFCLRCGAAQNPKPKKHTRKRVHGSGTISKDPRNKRHPYRALAPADWLGQKRVYIGSYETYKAAQDAIDAYIKRGRPELHNITLDGLYKLWSATHYQRVSKSAVSLYTSMWKKFEPIKKMRVDELRAEHFQGIVNSLTSLSACNSLKTMACMMMEYARKNDIVQKNYAEFIEIPKFEKKEKRIFTADEIKKLWEHSDDPDVQIILFLIYTGLRIGELAGLEKKNLHLDEGYIVCGEKTKAGRDRIVPLPKAVPELSQFLKKWAEKSDNDRVINSTTQLIRSKMFYHGLIVAGIAQGEVDKRTSGYVLKGNHHTPHSARHTFASLCSAAGMKQENLQKIIGHANFSTTAEVYIHQDIDTLAAEMAKIKK